MKASVIICTYNRSKLLKKTIQSILLQDFLRDQYEIIVVDNNSADDTAKVVKDLASSSSVRIEYVFEKNQGLSHARNAGIKKAKGKIIVFTDDDAEADKPWLRELVAAFDRPDVGAAGGPIRPVWPFEKPEWITESWLGYFTVSDFPEVREAGEFRNPNFPWGANMAFRRSLLKETALFPPALGRIGTCLLSNEEIRLFRKIEEKGFRIAFAPNAVVHHKIAPERLQKLWLYHRTYWQGRSEAILDRQSGNYVYKRVRMYSSGMFWKAISSEGDEFNRRLLCRIVVGYLYQLLADNKGSGHDFRQLRVLKTFLSEIVKTSAQHILDKDSEIHTLKRIVEDKKNEFKHISEVANRQDERIQNLSDYKDQLGKLDNILALLTEGETSITQLRQKDEQLIQKDEQLRLKDVHLREKFEQLKAKDEQLRRDSDRIAQLEAQVKEKEEQFRQKCEQLIQVDNQFREKCVEVVSKDKELMQACEERSGEKQRFEEELRLKTNDLKEAQDTLSARVADLSAREQELATLREERAAERQRLEEKLRLRADELKEAQDTVSARATELSAREQELVTLREERAAERQRLEEKLKHRADELKGTQDTLSARTAELSAKEQELVTVREERAADRQRLEEKLRLRADELKGTQDTLSARTAELSARDQELVTLREERAADRQRLEEKLRLRADELKEAQAALSARTAELSAREQKLVTIREERAAERQRFEEKLRLKSDELKEAQNSLIARTAEVAGREQELATLREERADEKLKLEGENRQKDKFIAELLGSMSWKVTSPLRAVYGIFKKDK